MTHGMDPTTSLMAGEQSITLEDIHKYKSFSRHSNIQNLFNTEPPSTTLYDKEQALLTGDPLPVHMRWDIFKEYVNDGIHKSASTLSDKKAITATNYIRNQGSATEPFKDYSKNWGCELIGGIVGLYCWAEDKCPYVSLGAQSPYAMMLGPLEHHATEVAPTGEPNGDLYMVRKTMKKMYVQLTDINAATCDWQGIPYKVVGPITLQNDLKFTSNQPVLVRTGANEPLVRHIFLHPTRLLTGTLEQIADVTGTEIKKLPGKKKVSKAAYVFWLVVALFPEMKPEEQHAMAERYMNEEVDCIGKPEDTLEWIESLDMESKQKFEGLAARHLHMKLYRLTYGPKSYIPGPTEHPCW
jgi:hypothetical protein